MERALDTLNRLLEAEHGNLIQRLAEAGPFVNWGAAEDKALIQRMIAAVRRHQGELADMILKLRGSPPPLTYPTDLGGVNFLKLSFLIPRVIAGVRELVRTYESSGTTGHPDADALIARILDDHRGHLAALERRHANLVETT